MSRLVRLAVSMVTALGLTAPAGAQQATGTVTGHVTEGESRRPIANAQVSVVGTTVGARTDASGAYRIGAAPAGPRTLRINLLGYQSVTRGVTVVPGSTVTIDVSLTAAPSILSAVVTTASGTEQSRRENGASVATVQADSIPKAAIQNFSNLLSGRTAGVTVSQSTGTTGMGARIRIRGSNSVSLSNEPLLIIDGVRIDNTPESNSIGIGGQSPSRLNDINPEDIESYDVIKGPAASALYGTAAANGVIQITTKHGRMGRNVWTAYGEAGTVNEENKYPPNYGGWTNTPGNTITFPFGAFRDPSKPAPTCNLYLEGLGACTIDSLQAFNTIELSKPFRTGHRQKLGGSLSGGNAATTYFVGTDVEQEAGVYNPSNLNRMSMRGNLNLHPTSALDIGITTGYIRSDLQLPQNDNNFYGVISDGLAGFPGSGGASNPFGYNPFPPSVFEQVDTRQGLSRFTGGANGTWRMLSWLSANATLGVDDLDRFDSETLQPNTIPFGSDFSGHRIANRFRVQNITTNYALTARNAVTTDVNSVAQVGYQFQRAQSQGTLAFGRTLTAGTSSLTGINSDRTLGEQNIDNKTAGGFLSEQLSWRERLYVTATLRADKNSAFGKNFGTTSYPALSASYVVAEGGDLVDQFRIRSAYGESGLRPGVLDAIAYFNPVTVRLDSTDKAGVTVGNLANPNLKAEHTREIEGGFDAGFFHDRARVEATYYDKRSRDALLLRPLPVSLGGPNSQFVNLGAVTNKGIELSLSGTPLQLDNATLNMTLTASTNRNNLVSLGGLPPITLGFAQRQVEGYPLGGYWGTTVDSLHLNRNGTLSPDSVFFSTDEAKTRYLGSALPTRQGGLSGDLTLFKWLRIGSLFEYRGGNKLFNASEQFRCLPFVATCRGLNDKTAPIAEQANAFANAVSGGAFYGGYIEDAGFVKWRELNVSVAVPSRYLSTLRASDALLTFGARNLHTWTSYSGIDPEVNVDGQANFSTTDFLTQPQVRYYTARLSLTF